MKLKFILLLIFFACSAAKCLNAQESSVTGLKEELRSLQTEIAAAQTEDQKYAGGLVKSLIAMRIQILKTTQSLLQQKIAAIETGTTQKMEIRITPTDTERAESLEKEILTKKQEIENQRKEAAKYSGGLVLSMKLATIATGEQTVAMLEQQYLDAKYGLPILPRGLDSKTEGSIAASPKKSEGQQELTEGESIVLPTVANKRFEKLKYQDYILFDVEWRAASLEKAARSIKGVLMFCDLFGDVKFPINVTIDDALEPSGSITQKAIGFQYNQFREEHSWIRNTNLENMSIRFKVTNILYQDGTRRDF